ncbi:nucleotidyltransferase domain-containing protein [Candidatus Kaiserbacteria bacterium]|nr:nucleotidyltransferase domain-containing protein [Candidatus Kaiserbacteria bacterium]
MKSINAEVLKGLAEKHGLSLVVLFGSQATGKTHAGSDTDIAFFSIQPKNMLEIAEMQMEFTEKLRIKDLELVDLAGKAPLFLKQVADQGIVLYEKDPSVFDEFQIYAFKRYVEAKPLYAMREAALHKYLQTV